MVRKLLEDCTYGMNYRGIAIGDVKPHCLQAITVCGFLADTD